MKKHTIKISFLSILLLATTVACNKEKDQPTPDEQELITTLKLQLTEATTTNAQTFVYKVENGFENGTGTIVIDTLKLKANTTYDAVLTVLNEKATPVEDITSEIIEKSDEHLFFFTATPQSGAGSIGTSNGNLDSKGAPLNQTFMLKTATVGNGSFQVVLKHQPSDKNATSLTTVGGDTDLDATFPVVLQ